MQRIEPLISPATQPTPLEPAEHVPFLAGSSLIVCFSLLGAFAVSTQPAWGWKVLSAGAIWLASYYAIWLISFFTAWMNYRAWKNYDPPWFPAWHSFYTRNVLHAVLVSALIAVWLKGAELLLVHAILTLIVKLAWRLRHGPHPRAAVVWQVVSAQIIGTALGYFGGGVMLRLFR